LLTLPKLLIDKTENTGIRSVILFYFSNIPIVVLAAGLVIHLKGLFSIASGGLSLWAIWVHCFMTAFNTLLVILLVKKRK